MNTLDQLIQAIDNGIIAIQSRIDYKAIKFKDEENKLSLSASAVVDHFNQLKLAALESVASQNKISETLLQQVSIMITVVIKSNESMIHKGQLDTSRTIEPESAESENKILQGLIAAIETYKVK